MLEACHLHEPIDMHQHRPHEIDISLAWGRLLQATYSLNHQEKCSEICSIATCQCLAPRQLPQVDTSASMQPQERPDFYQQALLQPVEACRQMLVGLPCVHELDVHRLQLLPLNGRVRLLLQQLLRLFSSFFLQRCHNLEPTTAQRVAL